jgi:predicted ATPase
MPITSIRLRNFRSFADSGKIPIKPLTVIFGRNNVGKPSILYSLFLLRQTLNSPTYGERLNLRGPLYAAGSFTNMIHQHRATENIIMAFGVRPSSSKRAGLLELEFPEVSGITLSRIDPGRPLSVNNLSGNCS